MKGFESTARLLSFRKAAEELNLTHPAISHQIQTLEESLGCKLFVREGRYSVLTDEGTRFYPVVREALELLTNGSESIRRSASKPILRIQTYISVSIRWLSHRLPRFQAQHPDLELHLISSIQEQHFDEINADIGLIFCRTPPEHHLHWTPLIPSKLFPVCSPGLIDNNRKPLQPQDILDYPLLTVTSEAWQWQDWFDSAGLSEIHTAHSISVDSTAIALEMAMDGEGITLVNGPFAEKDINAGRLIQPVLHCAEGLGEWGLVCRKDRLDQQHVRTFIEWLQNDMTLHR
ncbi:LysR substrate-binding domain-containing protein [Neptunomonas antarctica]|uniref:LysR family transcriptional regulator, glycine cleavage system transcriptional activator n=1 Tax=Neptunomonas antarctica TaxID=619304 RepID=A0A1N7KYX7_9GAMM|nr:LysR substrate-binding domain-containing protein [Neptunomonas antarctica]SIS66761.1 LysR family transcriptional regulator, glycine cleavage system transcriptional activator [Neptunomonas antarctica]